MRNSDHRGSEFSGKLALGGRGVCHEEEKIFGRADRGGAEAGGARDDRVRCDPTDGDLRADVLPLEKWASANFPDTTLRLSSPVVRTLLG